MPLLHVTSRIKGRKHDGLITEVGLKALFPSFAFLDPKGGVLVSKPGVLDIAVLESLAARAQKTRAAFLDLQAKAAAGDADAKQRVELMELELGHVTYADYRKRNPDLSKMREDVREGVLMFAGELLIKDAMAAVNATGGDREKINAVLLEVGEKLLAGAKEGAEPFDDEQRINFYLYLGTAGARHDRLDMLEAAIAALEDDAEYNENVAGLLAKWKQSAAKLKAATAPK